jgi:putative cofactor-binding repeat protein
MAADLSRVRFDARNDHSGVRLEQGRLFLDADWNAFGDLVERRMRAMAADLGSEGPIAGVAGVAVVPATTPHAFEIAYVPADPVGQTPADLQLGPGRLYVDGRIAENHGLLAGVAEEPSTDPLLGDPRELRVRSYLDQPYLPVPPPLPEAGTHLVYLDVRERELTAAVDPGLVEPAVGVETTSRTQTVWQVRVHPDDAPGLVPSSTDGEIPGWVQVVSPSAGRLSSGTVLNWADGDEACVLPPPSRYRGVENQLYRVEIHDPGPLGTATFKWSRDNASIVLPVPDVLDATHLRPASLGRDDVRGLEVGQWVEVIDDRAELDGRPGVLRRIVSPPTERGVIELDTALPAVYADLATGDPTLHHLRLIRWDQAGEVFDESGDKLATVDAGLGAITVPSAGGVQLERGIAVWFSVPPEPGAPPDVDPPVAFRTGDHWVFTARVATGGIEQLDQVPPRGIRHHHARLAILDAATGVLTDLRHRWPPKSAVCACTVCVTPESHAFGVLTIQQAVDQLVQTGGTVCLHAGDYALRQPISVDGHSAGFRLHGHTPGVRLVADGTAISAGLSERLELCDLEIVAPSGVGIDLAHCTDVRLSRLGVMGAQGTPTPVAVQLQGGIMRTTIEDCTFEAGVGISDVAVNGDPLYTAELTVRNNLIDAADTGVRFDGQAAHVLGFTVERNLVRSGGDGLRLLGLVDGDTGAAVVANAVWTSGGNGIVVAAGGYRVCENTVLGSQSEPTLAAVAVAEGSFADSRGHTVIDRNRLGGAFFGVRALVPVTSLVVADNTVDDVAECGISVEALTSNATVAGNTVRGTLGLRGVSTGIQVTGSTQVVVRDNTITGLFATTADPDVTGIRLLNCLGARVTGNLVAEIGVETGTCTGILVNTVAGLTHLDGNVVRRADHQDVSADLAGIIGWTGIRVEDPDERYIFGPGLGTGFNGLGGGWIIVGFPQGTAHDVLVSGNAATGGMRTSACIVDSPAGEATVVSNRFIGPTTTATPVLSVGARAGTVQGNRVFGGQPDSITLGVGTFAVLGNLTDQRIIVAGVPLAAPWAALNLTGVVIP